MLLPLYPRLKDHLHIALTDLLVEKPKSSLAPFFLSFSTGADYALPHAKLHVMGAVEKKLLRSPSMVNEAALALFQLAKKHHGTMRLAETNTSPLYTANLKRPTLVLHFDINETILIGDEAGGDSREDCFNKMIAKSAFVRMPAEMKSETSYDDTLKVIPTQWIDGSPIQEVYDVGTEPPALYTAWDWPEQCCPYYRTAFKKRAKNFVEHHGSIYKQIYNEMQEKVKPNESLEIDSTMAHIIPAFFETLVELCRRQITYILVFRTLGTDLVNVMEALSAFARGEHPDFPNFVNENLIQSEQNLVKGMWAESTEGNFIYQLWKDDKIVASGDAEVLAFIHSQQVCGIQDDYAFWHKNGYEPWAGKPVWIPRNHNFHHILFDDNIHNLEHDSIAGVRVEMEDGTFHALKDSDLRAQHGRHLIRVPTVEPILHRDWFIRQIDSACQNINGADD